MLIVTLVATLSAGMVWQQWKGIEVETAERARSQASWLIEGATDWARLILRTDAQDREHPNVDTLNEPWNTPLKDVKLSDFLAADKNNTADTGLEAFLSGQITDAQSHYNLRNLVNDEDEEAAKELTTLRRLCEALGIPPEAAARIADGMKGADLAEDQLQGYMEAAVEDGFTKDAVQHAPVVASGTVLIGIGPLLLQKSLTDDNTTLPIKMENLSIND